MDLIERITPQLSLFFILYGGATVTAVILCFYLLLRRGNAIAADVTPPMRLRRWAAAFLAAAALSHILWFLVYLYSRSISSVCYVVVCLLDFVMLYTTIVGTLLSMLQDRKRPLWPFVIAMVPIVLLGVLQVALPGVDFMLPGRVCVLSLYALFTIYMVIAVRQYGRWLRDNYADIEHKEVMQSHILLIVLLLVIVSDEFVFESLFLIYFVRVICFVLFVFLLWRVETLPQLEVVSKHEENSHSSAKDEIPEPQVPPQVSPQVSPQVPPQESQKTQTIPSIIGQLLAKHCVDAHLYLQHDLSLTQLAAAVGTNRSYLSQYFSNQGTTYNAYINNLRIDYFVTLYREAVATRSIFTLQQLASDSGYRSYSTFSLAFKQRMGQSVTAWIRGADNEQRK